MKVEEIKTFIEELDKCAQQSPEEAWKFFQKNWLQLELSSKEIIRIILATPYLISLFTNDNILESKIYFAAILNMAGKPAMEERMFENEPIAKLRLRKGINLKHMAKIFYKLKTGNFILNSNEDIAESLSRMFDISYDTAYSYLTDASRLENTDDLIS